MAPPLHKPQKSIEFSSCNMDNGQALLARFDSKTMALLVKAETHASIALCRHAGGLLLLVVFCVCVLIPHFTNSNPITLSIKTKVK